MTKDLPNIKHKRVETDPTVDSPTSEYEIPFYKDVDYFASLDNFVSFIKAVERAVRRSDEYRAYKKYLIEEIGLENCQVLSNIKGSDNVKVEMHHGPILTLFDSAAILTDWMIAKDKKITSFNVAKLLLDEHFNNNIQVVMVSETVHELVHDGEIFINLKQAFGDLNTFINKYREGLNISHIKKINRYIKQSIEQDSFDNDILRLNKTIHNWSKEFDEDISDL